MVEILDSYVEKLYLDAHIRNKNKQLVNMRYTLAAKNKVSGPSSPSLADTPSASPSYP